MEWSRQEVVWGSHATFSLVGLACPLTESLIVELWSLLSVEPQYTGWLGSSKGRSSNKMEEGAGLSLTFGFALSTAERHKVGRFNADGCQLTLPVSAQPVQESATSIRTWLRWLPFTLYCGECVIAVKCKQSWRYQKQDKQVTLRAKNNLGTVCVWSIH